MAFELTQADMVRPAAPTRPWPAWLRELSRPPFILYAPAALFLTAFFLVPLGLVVWMSLSEPEFGLGNYAGFFTSTYDLSVLARTFETALGPARRRGRAVCAQ
ncbi:MAG: hypothetical protein ACHQAQ_03600 [Hyphomicrobiales bacterium]